MHSAGCNVNTLRNPSRNRTAVRNALLNVTAGALLVVAAALPAGAQAGRIKLDHLAHEQGLSQVTIFAMLQDRKGFMWFGTEDGLNRFDGQRVEVFRHDPDDPESLAENIAIGLYEDRDGMLWVINQKPGVINRFDPRSERFRRFVHDPEDPATPQAVRRNPGAVLDTGDGFLWFGTFGRGPERLTQASGRITRTTAAPDGPAELAEAVVTTFFQDRAGTLWVGTQRGLYQRLPLAGPDAPERFRRFVHGPDDPSSLGHDVVTALYEDRAGDLWIGTAGGGVCRFDRAAGRCERFRHVAGDPTTLPSDLVPSIRGAFVEDLAGRLWVATQRGLARFDRERRTFTAYGPDLVGPDLAADARVLRAVLCDRWGTLWVATSTGGLFRLDPEPEGAAAETAPPRAFRRYTHDPIDPKSLGSDLLTSLYESRSGILWIGTASAGVDRFSRAKHKFTHYRSAPASPATLADDMVFALLKDRAGAVWVGTQTGGLHRFDAARERVVERYSNAPGTPRDLGADWVRALLEDRAGRLWVGTVGGGLAQVDPASGRVVARYRNDPEDPASLSNDAVFSIFEDRRGELWLGTNFGWNRFDPARGTFRAYFNRPGDPASLIDGSVRLTYEDRAGNLWLGTFSGLSRFDRDTETFTHYTHDLNDPGSLRSDHVMDLYDDGAGGLWIATYGGGLDRLEPATGRFTHLTWKDGLPSDSIYSILPDDAGRFWLSTNRGLARLDPATRDIVVYDVDDGLQSNEFNGRSFYKAADGELLFGGVNGFNAFYPENVRPDPYVPPVVLTAFSKLDREERFPLAVDELERVTLSHRDLFFSFEFAALDYSTPERNRYAYQLVGFDRDWVDAGNRPYASYTNLDGGRYRFRVRGSNGDGVWNQQGREIEVVVVPPPWQTWWAYLLYGVVGLALVFGYVHLKTAAQEEELLQQRRSDELERARRIQLSLLPQTAPAVPFLDIAVYMHTATEVGGDYYDFFPQDDGSLFVVTGDATGHGLSAGMMVSMTKAALKSLEVQAPHILLTRLNEVIRAVNPDRMKMALNAVHVTESEIALSSAGMPPAYLFRAAGGEVEELLVPGLPLGSLEDHPYRLERAPFDPGDVLVLISDGLAERTDGRDGLIGYEVVRRQIAEAGDGAALTVLASLIDLADSAGRPFEDDVTAVVVRRI